MQTFPSLKITWAIIVFCLAAALISPKKVITSVHCSALLSRRTAIEATFTTIILYYSKLLCVNEFTFLRNKIILSAIILYIRHYESYCCVTFSYPDWKDVPTLFLFRTLDLKLTKY